jgi:hypothetical protein
MFQDNGPKCIGGQNVLYQWTKRIGRQNVLVDKMYWRTKRFGGKKGSEDRKHQKPWGQTNKMDNSNCL